MTDDEKRRWKGPSDKRGTSGRRMGERKIIAHRAKNESSKRWIERQLQDPYVQKARSEGYRARAAYKLLEIEEKLHLFRRGQRVVDLGCAPANTTGHKQTDHLRTVALVEMAAAFAIEHLAPGGTFCSKVFQGGATKEVLDLLKANFTSVKHIKPPASRAGSPEIFVVAKGFRGSRKAG